MRHTVHRRRAPFQPKTHCRATLPTGEVLTIEITDMVGEHGMERELAFWIRRWYGEGVELEWLDTPAPDGAEKFSVTRCIWWKRAMHNERRNIPAHIEAALKLNGMGVMR